MSRAFIIDPTISAIDGLYDLLGIGIPNQGGILYSSLEYFEKALEELAAASGTPYRPPSRRRFARARWP